MATITLYANKVNQMPGLIKNVKRSVTDYKSELSNLRKKTLSVDRKVCNMDDIISQVQSSTKTQEQKIQFLDKVSKDSEDFITDTARIDSNVADVVNKRKDDFYEKYYYLKPECEKSRWEKVKDGCKKVGEWCKEHWRVVVAVVVVIAAVALAVTFPGLAPLLIVIGKHALSGAILGGLIGGGLSSLSGESFWKGFEEGAFMGAIMGAFEGAGVFLGGSCTALEALGGFDKVSKVIKTTFKISGGITGVMGGFDILALGIGLKNPNNPLVILNQKLHTSVLYNGIQFVAGAAAAFSGGAYRKMKQGPPACFVAGTMVLTAEGLIAIENIKSGDKVIATDPITFQTEEKTVLETYVREVPHLVHIQLNNEELITTVEHPFYLKDQGFVKACDLQEGYQIVNAIGGICTVEAANLEIVEKREKVYNFQVEDFHTYYVGNSSVLVHNANYSKGNEGGSDSAYHLAGGDKAEKKIQSVLDGIDINYTSPDSRFGQGFYVAGDGKTSVAELAYHGTDASYAIRYDMNLEGQKVLDLTDSLVANKWRYVQGESSLLECHNIADRALDEGFTVIKVQSYRYDGINYVIYDNFDEILSPQMVIPVQD